MIDALTRSGRLPDVHADVLLNDRSPDVPQRTSDALLFDVISRAAQAHAEGDPGAAKAAWEAGARAVGRESAS